jgi:hypothetical protein
VAGDPAATGSTTRTAAVVPLAVGRTAHPPRQFE